jgi:hypothetical protein
VLAKFRVPQEAQPSQRQAAKEEGMPSRRSIQRILKVCFGEFLTLMTCFKGKSSEAFPSVQIAAPTANQSKQPKQKS